MRKLIILQVFLFVMVTSVFSQRQELATDLNISGHFIKKYRGNPKGQTFILKDIIKIAYNSYPPATFMILDIDGNRVQIPAKDMKVLELLPTDLQSFWMTIFVEGGMFGYFDKKGFSYSLRNELMEESRDYIRELSNANLLYEDVLVEDYVQKLFSRIAPVGLHAGLPELKGIHILKSPSPDSYMLPGGIFMITTGLLSVLDSEEELIAILASELVHYVLDHQVVNVRKQMSRVQRAAFWGGVAQVLAFATDEYLNQKYDDYEPGGLTFSAALISSAVFANISQRMGMNYSQQQVQDSDRIARRVLSQLGLNQSALSTGLKKIYDYYLEQKDLYALSSEGPHYLLRQRMAGVRETFYDKEYKWNIAGANTFNAISQLFIKDYAAAMWFANKNVESGLATDEDFIVLSKANLALYDTPESNQESLDLIDKAIKMAKVPSLSAYKQRLIIVTRLQKRIDIKVAINEYLDLLAEYQINVYKPEDLDWCKREINWTNKLKAKYQ